MFCPQCGITQSEELKFCKACGANLYAVRQVVTTRETDQKFDWSKTWVAEMLLSQDEQRRRKRERESGISAIEKRSNEIKAGVITSSVGLGLMIFLYVFMNGIILGSHISAGAAEILSRIWVAGVIPFFVGLAILFNGLVVSKRLTEIPKGEMPTKEGIRRLDAPPDWYESDSPKPSVTENTTRELEQPGRNPIGHSNKS